MFDKEFAPYVKEIQIGQIGEMITSIHKSSRHYDCNPHVFILYCIVYFFAIYPYWNRGFPMSFSLLYSCTGGNALQVSSKWQFNGDTIPRTMRLEESHGSAS